MKKIIWIPLVVIASLIAMAAIVYYIGTIVFATNFAFNITVNGEDVSRTEMAAAVEKVRSTYPETFTITEKDGSELTIPINDLVTNNDIEQFVEDQAALADVWYESWFSRTDFKSSDRIYLNEDAFKKRVEDALNSVPRKAAVNAKIDIEEMVVVAEQYGNELDVKSAVDKAWKAADENIYGVTLDEEYLEPQVRWDDPGLHAILDEYDKRIDRTITIAIAGGITETIGKTELEQWISYDGKTFLLDEGAVAAYAEGLAVKYDTAFSERSFMTSLGYPISIGTGPNDSYTGWMLDTESTDAVILDAIYNGSDQAQAVWILTGYTLEADGTDIGGTYIEVSIDAQHMWYYENHALVIETDVVTGMESNPERATPRGFFYLLEMASPYVMHGDYGEQPCDFFIKVTWDGVAIHDADWQSSFGGTQYIYAGSHGCINTPYWAVSSLWDHLVSLDDWQVPVIIY